MTPNQVSESRFHRILLVEDEAVIALSEKQTIERYGFEVLLVHSGKEAVETATADHTIDLVLMDIDLGAGLDGTEAAQRILAARDVPIVFLTAHTEKEYVDRVKSISSYGYVLKSAGEFVLIESIEMALKLFEAHQATAEREEQLDYVVNEAPIGIFQSASSGEFRYMNSEMARILRFDSPEEAVQHYTDIGREIYVSEERRQAFLSRLTRDGVVRDFRVDAYRSTGERAYLNVHARYAGMEGGVLIVNGFVVDETEQRHAEEQLHEAHETYRLVATLAQELIVQHDADGRWTFVNDEACRFFGKSAEDLIGEHFLHYVHPEDRERTRSSLHNLVEKREPVAGLINRQWTPRGWRRVQWNSSPIIGQEGSLRGHQAIGRDITQQHELRQQLEQEHKKWSRLFHQAPVGIFLTDSDHRIVDANPFAARMLGYAIDELRGLCAEDVLHPEEVAASAPENSATTLREHGEPIQRERRYRTKEGSYLHVMLSVAELSGIGEEVSYLVMFQDITERRQLQEEYRVLAENIPDIVFRYDLQTEYLSYVSPSVQSILGYTAQDARSMPLEALLSPESAGYVKELKRHWASVSLGPDNTIEVWARHNEGHLVPLECRVPAGLTHDGETEGHNAWEIVGVARDIGDRKQAENELKRALEQKDWLMQELNHRVKNNLLMVGSLINLKDAALGPAVDLSDVSDQIQAIQIVHEKLQGAGDVGGIELHDYLQDLLEAVFTSFTQKRVSLDLRVPELTVHTRFAVPLGLIINEFATNAVKHGFTGDEEPRFSVQMEHDTDTDQWVLTVSNSGAPLPDSIDTHAPQTLGLQLISALVSQIRGSLQVQRHPHPVFTIRFPGSVL